MKKIALIVSMLFGFAAFSQAQTTPPKDAKKAKTTTAKSTAAPKTAATTAKPAVGPTKKDGTPDMRYKANKDAAKTPPAHLKKDGTPDMRYKENKKPADKPKPATAPKKAS